MGHVGKNLENNVVESSILKLSYVLLPYILCVFLYSFYGTCRKKLGK